MSWHFTEHHGVRERPVVLPMSLRCGKNNFPKEYLK